MGARSTIPSCPLQYAHRMMGRALGVIYGVPLLYFGIRGRIPQHIRGRVAALFALGGAQGLVGWWMVKSGLEVIYILKIMWFSEVVRGCEIGADLSYILKGLHIFRERSLLWRRS